MGESPSITEIVEAGDAHDAMDEMRIFSLSENRVSRPEPQIHHSLRYALLPYCRFAQLSTTFAEFVMVLVSHIPGKWGLRLKFDLQ